MILAVSLVYGVHLTWESYLSFALHACIASRSLPADRMVIPARSKWSLGQARTETLPDPGWPSSFEESILIFALELGKILICYVLIFHSV